MPLEVGSEAMLQIQGLEVGYGESIILRDISLKVSKGQVVCLMGRNGVGKTTLIRAIMGVLPAKKGTISYGKTDITKKSPDQRARMGIGYVPQGREIFSQLTVEENIQIGLEANRFGRKAVPAEATVEFPVLKQMAKRRGGDLSGGQQQQLAFARALTSEPEVLLLDEPTEGIQPSIVQDIQNVIHKLKKRGDLAILLVEQSVEFVLEVGDYFYVLDKGAIVAEGPMAMFDESLLMHHLSV